MKNEWSGMMRLGMISVVMKLLIVVLIVGSVVQAGNLVVNYKTMSFANALRWFFQATFTFITATLLTSFITIWNYPSRREKELVKKVKHKLLYRIATLVLLFGLSFFYTTLVVVYADDIPLSKTIQYTFHALFGFIFSTMLTLAFSVEYQLGKWEKEKVILK